MTDREAPGWVGLPHEELAFELHACARETLTDDVSKIQSHETASTFDMTHNGRRFSVTVREVRPRPVEDRPGDTGNMAPKGHTFAPHVHTGRCVTCDMAPARHRPEQFA